MLAIFFPGWEMQETGSLAHTRGQDSASATTSPNVIAGVAGQDSASATTSNRGEAPGQRKRPLSSSTRPLSLHFNTWQNRELCMNERHYEEGS